MPLLALQALLSFCDWENNAMAAITVRNLPEEVHRALRIRAAQNGRSTEAEVRDILARAALPQAAEEPLKIGTELRKFWAEHGFPELDIRRDPQPIEPASFD
jgi:antitoxin FitA